MHPEWILTLWSKHFVTLPKEKLNLGGGKLLLPFIHPYSSSSSTSSSTSPTTHHLPGCSRLRAPSASSKVKCTYISHSVLRGAVRQTEGKITGSCGADLVLFWGSRSNAAKGPRLLCRLASSICSSGAYRPRETRDFGGCRLEERWGNIDKCNFREFDYMAVRESTPLVFCRLDFFYRVVADSMRQSWDKKK